MPTYVVLTKMHDKLVILFAHMHYRKEKSVNRATFEK